MRWWGNPAQHQEGREDPTFSPNVFFKFFQPFLGILNCFLPLLLSSCTWPPSDLTRMWRHPGSSSKPLFIILGLLLPGGTPQPSSSLGFVHEPLFWIGREGLYFNSSPKQGLGNSCGHLRVWVACSKANLFFLLASKALTLFRCSLPSLEDQG